jgi:hypothetical protein
MTQQTTTVEQAPKPAWSAIYGLGLSVAGLITSEFQPVIPLIFYDWVQHCL